MASRTIGIIAGNGVYPETFARAARASGEDIQLVAAAFDGETKPRFADEVDVIQWFKVGQLGKMIKFFTEQGVTETIMVGQISPNNLFNFRPDLRTIGVLARLKERNAESMFGAIGDELSKEGMPLISAITFLEDGLALKGHMYGPKLKGQSIYDTEYGFKIAKESSRLDIGQSVIVREGTVLAVEAFEGTNACILRGGKLGRGKNITLAKVSKPNQDFRFDVPVIGPRTIETCKESGVRQIAVEAGCTLVLEPEQVAKLCDKLKVSVVGLSLEESLSKDSDD